MSGKIKHMNSELFCMYILKCNDGSYYTGHTDNIDNRIEEHKLGKIDSYTSKRLPINLVYIEYFQTRDEAFVAERKIKKWTRRKKEILILSGLEGFKK